MVSTAFVISGLAFATSSTVKSSNGLASWMLASVSFKEVSSLEILATVAFAASTCNERVSTMIATMDPKGTHSLALESLDDTVPLGDVVVDGLER